MRKRQYSNFNINLFKKSSDKRYRNRVFDKPVFQEHQHCIQYITLSYTTVRIFTLRILVTRSFVGCPGGRLTLMSNSSLIVPAEFSRRHS